MNEELLYALGISLAATLILEMGFFLLVRALDKNCVLLFKAHVKKDIILVVMVNVVTNPAVVLIYWLTILYANINEVLTMAALEIFAVLIEGYYYNRYGQGFKRPYLFSAAANVFSFGVGVLVQNLFL